MIQDGNIMATWKEKPNRSYYLVTWESHVPNYPFTISPLDPFRGSTRLYILWHIQFLTARVSHCKLQTDVCCFQARCQHVSRCWSLFICTQNVLHRITIKVHVHLPIMFIFSVFPFSLSLSHYTIRVKLFSHYYSWVKMLPPPQMTKLTAMWVLGSCSLIIVFYQV